MALDRGRARREQGRRTHLRLLDLSPKVLVLLVELLHPAQQQASATGVGSPLYPVSSPPYASATGVSSPNPPRNMPRKVLRLVQAGIASKYRKRVHADQGAPRPQRLHPDMTRQIRSSRSSRTGTNPTHRNHAASRNNYKRVRVCGKTPHLRPSTYCCSVCACVCVFILPQCVCVCVFILLQCVCVCL